MSNYPLEIANQVLITVISAAIIGAIAWASHRLWNWVSSLNTAWSLRVNQNELKKMEDFKRDPNELTRFLLKQLSFVIPIFGGTMMFAPIAVSAGGTHIVAFVSFVCGSLIYALGIYAAATALRGKTPDKFIPSLKKRIDTLKRRIAIKRGSRERISPEVPVKDEMGPATHRRGRLAIRRLISRSENFCPAAILLLMGARIAIEGRDLSSQFRQSIASTESSGQTKNAQDVLIDGGHLSKSLGSHGESVAGLQAIRQSSIRLRKPFTAHHAVRRDRER